MVTRFLKYQEVSSILESSTDLRREQRSNFAPPKANWRTATKRGSVLASAPCMNLGSGWNWQIHANSWIFLGPGCIHDASRTLAKRKNAIERLILRICRTKVKLVPCPHHPTGLKNWQTAPVLPMFVKKLTNHCLKLLLQNLRAECSLHPNKTRDEHPAAWSMLNAQNWRNGNKEETKPEQNHCTSARSAVQPWVPLKWGGTERALQAQAASVYTGKKTGECPGRWGR